MARARHAHSPPRPRPAGFLEKNTASRLWIREAEVREGAEACSRPRCPTPHDPVLFYSRSLRQRAGEAAAPLVGVGVGVGCREGAARPSSRIDFSQRVVRKGP